MTDHDTIGRRLRHLRKSAGLSQETISDLVYVSRETVRDWELDICRPTCDSLIALAQCYHVSADFILGVSDSAGISLERLTNDEAKAVTMLVQAMEKANQKSAS